MREIKFRAWDESKDRWIHQTGYIHIDLDGDVTYCDDDGSETNRNDLVIQQYTGLKDKNGVEIYEGDVVRGYKRNYADDEYTVVWNDDLAGFDPFISNFEVDWATDRDSFEVIGNIYENPELVK